MENVPKPEFDHTPPRRWIPRLGDGRRLSRAGGTGIRHRLLIPLSASLLLLIAGSAAALLSLHRVHLHRSSTNLLQSVGAELSHQIGAQSRALAALQQVILSHPDLAEAMRSRDRHRLLADWQGVFDELHETAALTHFYFSDPDRVCLLRVHAPDRYGDRFDRFTALAAERTGTLASGIELGPLGTFTLRVVRPVFHEGDLIGYLELGKEIEDILEHILAVHGEEDLELVVDIRKTFLDRQRWEQGMKLLGRDADWERFPDSVLIYASKWPTPPEWDVFIEECSDRGRAASRQVHSEGSTWQLLASPLFDAAGNQVGDLLVLENITESLAAFRRTLLLVVTGAGVLFAILMGGCNRLLYRNDETIDNQQAALEERIKELACLHGIWAVVNEDAPPEQVAQVSAACLVQGVQHPDLAAAAITWEGYRYATSNWKDGLAPALRAEVASSGSIGGCVAVAYTEARPFIAEEQSLVDAVAAILAQYYQRKRMEDSLQHANDELQQLVESLESANRALVESESMFRGLFDHAVSAVVLHEVLFDDQGNPADASVLKANPAFQTHTGLSVANVTGKRMKEIFPEGDVLELLHAFGEVVQTGKARVFETFLAPLQRHFHVSVFAMEGNRCAAVFQDTTGRKVAEESLRASEAKLRMILDHSSDLIWQLSMEGIFTYLSPSWKRMTGYEPESLLGSPFHPLVHPDDLPKCDALLSNAMKTAKVSSLLEYRVRHADGAWCWHSGRITPVLDAQGNVTSVVGVSRDISERKEMELALRKTTEELEYYFTTSLDLLCIADTYGRFLRLNPQWEETLGYPLAELVGRSFLELVHPDDQEGTLATIAQLNRQESVLNFENRYRCKDGTYRWIEWRAHSRGEIIYSVARDVTDRKLAEARLEEQTRLLQTILDGLPDVVSLQDIDRTIISYNRAGYQLVGKPPEEVVGQKCFSMLGQSIPCENCVADEARASGQVVSQDRHIAALQRWIRNIAIPILDNSGHPEMIVVQIQDITSQMEAQRDLQHTIEALESANQALEEFSQRAESATLAKSEFLANMSHEIRTPMTAILGFAEVLLREPVIENAPPECVEALRTIQRNGQYLLELINDILDLSKIEAGKLTVERVPCAPAQILEEVISLMRVRAEAKGIPLSLEFAAPIPASIQSDPLRMRQVLINVVGNAIKFTETGHVRVVVGLTRDRHGKALLEVDVIDTGIGLVGEQIVHLFEPFSQADSSTTRKFGGTGLGLTISKRLTEMLGGDICARSAPGEGSTFSVTFDAGDIEGVGLLAGAAEVSTLLPVSPANSTTELRLRGRILLAEDGPDNQRLIAFLLRKAGAEVTVAENGQVAHDKVLSALDRGEPFDLVLMDMQMPVLDGYEATRMLRARGYEGPIIALTAHAMEGAETECRNAGCDGYLTKPITRAELLADVAEWMTSASKQMPKKSLL